MKSYINVKNRVMLLPQNKIGWSKGDIVKRISDGFMLLAKFNNQDHNEDWQAMHLYLLDTSLGWKERLNILDYVICPDNSITTIVGFDDDVKMHFVIINGEKCYIDGNDYGKIVASTDMSLNLMDIQESFIIECITKVKYDIFNK